MSCDIDFVVRGPGLRVWCSTCNETVFNTAGGTVPSVTVLRLMQEHMNYAKLLEIMKEMS